MSIAPPSPLLCCFSVLDPIAQALGGEPVALVTFARRVAVELERMGLAPRASLRDRSHVLSISPPAVLQDLTVWVEVRPEDRAFDRAQFAAFTCSDSPWETLPRPAQALLAAIHERVVELVVSWSETEDVDAAGPPDMMPSGARIYGSFRFEA